MIDNLFGLIGQSLKHTFSPGYFKDKFNDLNLDGHRYTTFEFDDPDNIKNLKGRPEIKGLNVTIPYKEAILSHLDAISEDAFNIGAVNTVKVVDGHWTGYNTDVMGFNDMLETIQQNRPTLQQALILGSGGASKAVQYVCEKRNISFQVISRKGEYNYDNLTSNMLQDADLTLFLIECEANGALIKNGHEMLISQAEHSWNIWNQP